MSDPGREVTCPCFAATAARSGFPFLRRPCNLALFENYTLVHVNIGLYDQNQDLAARYDIPLSKGVPALAVLDSSGKPLYVQRNGEFESDGRHRPTAVTGLPNRWKP